jgi:hypothetical protein
MQPFNAVSFVRSQYNNFIGKQIISRQYKII